MLCLLSDCVNGGLSALSSSDVDLSMDPFTGLSMSPVPDFNSAFAEAHGPQRSPILGCA